MVFLGHYPVLQAVIQEGCPVEPLSLPFCIHAHTFNMREGRLIVAYMVIFMFSFEKREGVVGSNIGFWVCGYLQVKVAVCGDDFLISSPPQGGEVNLVIPGREESSGLDKVFRKYFLFGVTFDGIRLSNGLVVVMFFLVVLWLGGGNLRDSLLGVYYFASVQ